MIPLELLRKAKELIADGTRWTQGVYARDIDGNSRDPGEPEAVKFCALGALRYCGAIEDNYDTAVYFSEVYLAQCCSELYQHNVVDTNDHLGHKEILKAFDCAIQHAEGDENEISSHSEILQD